MLKPLESCPRSLVIWIYDIYRIASSEAVIYNAVNMGGYGMYSCFKNWCSAIYDKSIQMYFYRQVLKGVSGWGMPPNLPPCPNVVLWLHSRLIGLLTLWSTIDCPRSIRWWPRTRGPQPVSPARDAERERGRGSGWNMISLHSAPAMPLFALL